MTDERTEIISFLQQQDIFFTKVNFEIYTIEELRAFKSKIHIISDNQSSPTQAGGQSKQQA